MGDYFEDFALQEEDYPSSIRGGRGGSRWQLPVAIAALLGLVAVGVTAVVSRRNLPIVLQRPSLASPPDSASPSSAPESAQLAHPGLPFWTLEISPDGQRLTVRAAGLPSRPVGYRYELWAWPKDGQPVQLVPLPVAGKASYDLTANMVEALQRSGRVAVTVEAAGPRRGPPRVILSAPLKASVSRL